MNKKIKQLLTGICLLSLLAAGTGCAGGQAGEQQTASRESGGSQIQAARSDETPDDTQTAAPSENADETDNSIGGSEDPRSLLCIDAQITVRIVEGAETGNLVLAGESSGSVYTLTVGDIPVYLDGEPASADALEDGMTAEISYDGSVMETWPAQLGNVTGIFVCSRGTEKNPGGTMYDLSGLYLKVLEDLWETDPGLNEGITYISVDLSDAPGNLTEGEKAAIAWIFAGRHGGVPLTLSYGELVEQGYCGELDWEDGILFRIYGSSSGESAVYSIPVINFDAQKWCSGDGAYFFMDCQAGWPEMGTWTDYTVGSEAIS